MERGLARRLGARLEKWDHRADQRRGGGEAEAELERGWRRSGGGREVLRVPCERVEVKVVRACKKSAPSKQAWIAASGRG